MDCHRYVNPFTGGQHGGYRNFFNAESTGTRQNLDRIQKTIHTPNWIHRLQKLSYYIYIYLYNNNDNDNKDSDNDDIVIYY